MYRAFLLIAVLLLVSTAHAQGVDNQVYRDCPTGTTEKTGVVLCDRTLQFSIPDYLGHIQRDSSGNATAYGCFLDCNCTLAGELNRACVDTATGEKGSAIGEVCQDQDSSLWGYINIDIDETMSEEEVHSYCRNEVEADSDEVFSECQLKCEARFSGILETDVSIESEWTQPEAHQCCFTTQTSNVSSPLSFTSM